MYQKWQNFYEADGGAGGGGEAKADPAKEPAKAVDDEKKFTQKQVEDIIAKEKSALQKLTEKKEAEILEAERLKGLSEQERKDEELKIAQAKLAQYETEKLQLQFEKELAVKELPVDLAKIVPVADADQAKDAIDRLAKFKEEVIAPLKSRVAELEKALNDANLRGAAPSAVGTSGADKKTDIPTIF